MASIRVVLVFVALGSGLSVNASAVPAHSIVGRWECHPKNGAAARNVIEHWEFETNGLERWHYSPYRLTSSYKFDGRTLTIYGEHLPGVLKWSITFTSPNSYVATPIQGKIVGETCVRESLQ